MRYRDEGHNAMHHNTRHWPLIIAALCAWGGLAPSARCAQASPHLSHVACVIQLAEKTLLLQDPWSHRYALPGGAIGLSERLQDAAVRHTYETTGLAVATRRQLGTVGQHAIFDCQLVAPVPLLPGGVVLLPAEARYATIEARFIEASGLKHAQWRYMRAVAPTLALIGSATPNDTAWVRAVSVSSSPLFEAELAITRAVQAGMPQHLDASVAALSQLGTEQALFIAAILVWCLCGWRHGLEFALYIVTLSLLNCLLKQACQLPRPFHLDPRLQLQLQHASSFGFPSGHTACVSSMALWLGARVLPARLSVRACLVLAVLGCSLSRVYLGVHFTHDVLGAWAESLAFFALYVGFWRHGTQAHVPLGYWTAFTVVLACIALGSRPEPEPIVFICMNVGLLAGSVCCRGASRPLRFRHASLLGLAMALGFVCLHRYVAYARPQKRALRLACRLSFSAAWRAGF